jgi:hypothetical protein
MSSAGEDDLKDDGVLDSERSDDESVDEDKDSDSDDAVGRGVKGKAAKPKARGKGAKSKAKPQVNRKAAKPKAGAAAKAGAGQKYCRAKDGRKLCRACGKNLPQDRFPPGSAFCLRDKQAIQNMKYSKGLTWAWLGGVCASTCDLLILAYSIKQHKY